jgi:hypothetical protein
MNRYETVRFATEYDLALHASASLITHLSRIQDKRKTTTITGSACKMQNAMYPYSEEKIVFNKLNFHKIPPAEETTRKPTARNVGRNSSHSLASSTFTAR